MERSVTPIAIGDVLLDKYRVERVLGKGGMGIVVAARHLELDELFAIKFMLAEGATSPEAIERFLREARAAAKIKSEHVARVQDVGRLPDGTPYMVMEHLTGSDLKKVLRARGPLPLSEAVQYVLQACETLSEAHMLGIIHRDVKPANMFLTHRRNGSPCVKVLDFGISKHTGADDVGLTATATVGGSPLYMSPEQMRSTKYVDARTDIWSIGIVLYELLTGATPFKAATITAVAGRVLQDEPSPPSHMIASIPPALDAVILKCLAKHPDGRYSSVEALMTALRSAISESPGDTLPPTTGETSRVAHPPATRTAATIELLVPERAGGGSTWAALAPAAVTQQTTPQTRARFAAVILVGALVLGGFAAGLVQSRRAQGSFPVAGGAESGVGLGSATVATADGSAQVTPSVAPLQAPPVSEQPGLETQLHAPPSALTPRPATAASPATTATMTPPKPKPALTVPGRKRRTID